MMIPALPEAGDTNLVTPEWGKGKVVPTEMALNAVPEITLSASSKSTEALAKAAWIAKLDQ